MLPYLSAYWLMMPVLQAQESLVRSTEIAVGTANLKKSDRNRIRRRWERLARGPRGHGDVRKPKSQEEHGALLASLGIQTVAVEKS